VHPEIHLLIRLLVAGVLAAMLGWERERARKAAGLRTHMLVGIAAALYTAIAELAVLDIPPNSEGFQADPIRAVQAVAIGIGFLGSGVIFVSRHEDRVRGLTTAASIWATAPSASRRDWSSTGWRWGRRCCCRSCCGFWRGSTCRTSACPGLRTRAGPSSLTDRRAVLSPGAPARRARPASP
jgi:putative Mg2+ transporter-C (MgtC) family protein